MNIMISIIILSDEPQLYHLTVTYFHAFNSNKSLSTSKSINCPGSNPMRQLTVRPCQNMGVFSVLVEGMCNRKSTERVHVQRQYRHTLCCAAQEPLPTG